MIKLTVVWIITTACALALASSHHLDDIVLSSLAADAKEAYDPELRRDMNAAKLCREMHGESGFTWRADGELVCLPKIDSMYRKIRK